MLLSNLTLPIELAIRYTSPSQRARVITQAWVEQHGYCPSCGDSLCRYEENRPVADFYCVNCSEDFELKAKSSTFTDVVNDGEYRQKIARLSSDSHPSLLLLCYARSDWRVRDFVVIPKQFFTADMIQRRNALQPTARRAGWVGSNILLSSVPDSARIHMIQDGNPVSQLKVSEKWRSTLFLRAERKPEARGWLLDIMKCVDSIGKAAFTLEEMYGFAEPLATIYPNNRHIRDKIRQQLQVLRDRGYLHFEGAGRYRVNYIR